MIPFSMWPRTLMKVVPEICELLIAASAPTSWGRRYFSRRLKKISDKAQDLRQRNRRVALLLRLSLVEERAANWTGAESLIRELLTLRPGDPSALISLASVLERTGDRSGAREIYVSLASSEDLRPEHRQQATREAARLAGR